jgi:hypothetical protein
VRMSSIRIGFTFSLFWIQNFCCWGIRIFILLNTIVSGYAPKLKLKSSNAVWSGLGSIRSFYLGRMSFKMPPIFEIGWLEAWLTV